MECEYIIIWQLHNDYNYIIIIQLHNYKTFFYENLYVSMYVAERLDKQGKLFRTFVIENFVIKPSCGFYGIFDYILYKIMSYIKQNSCSV